MSVKKSKKHTNKILGDVSPDATENRFAHAISNSNRSASPGRLRKLDREYPARCKCRRCGGR